MTTWLHENFKLAPDNGCFTDPQDGTVVCQLPGDPFPAAPVAIPPSWQGYTVEACWPTISKVSGDTPISAIQALCGDPTFNAQTPSTLDSALAQMASADALAPRIPASFFDSGAPVDFSGLFVGAALLAGAAASGVALLLAKKRRKNLAKQEATA
jgi:hypothetical protein